MAKADSQIGRKCWRGTAHCGKPGKFATWRISQEAAAASLRAGRVGDALVERQNTFLASHHDDGSKFEPLREAHGSGCHCGGAD